MEASTGIEPVYTDLQSAASPLRQLAAVVFSRSSKFERRAQEGFRKLAVFLSRACEFFFHIRSGIIGDLRKEIFRHRETCANLQSR